MLRQMVIGGSLEACFDEGEAQRGTLVLVHGFPDTPHSFAPLSERLVAQGYRVLRPYLPGYAPSTYQGPFDVGSLRAQLLGIIRRMCPEPCHLVGHDWGAVLGYALLSAHPDRFLSGVGLSVPHPSHLLSIAHREPAQLVRSSYMLCMQLPRAAERWLCAGTKGLVPQLWSRWSPGYSLSEEERWQVEECLLASGSRPFEYYRKLPRSLREWPRLFVPIATPFFYLHGVNDGCMAAHLSKGQRRLFGELYQEELVDGAGHFLQLETPDVIAERLDRWCQAASPVPGTL